MSAIVQTHTPIQFAGLPDKGALISEFKGRHVDTLRTPAAVIDRAVFARNCARMHDNAKAWDAKFRAHVKTHKTSEGVTLQLRTSSDETHAIVVSTLMEAHAVVRSGLVADKTVNDILYGLPVPVNKLEDLASLRDELAKYGGTIRILIDHPVQVEAIEKFEEGRTESKKWSAFMKVDSGGKRAGLEPSSPAFTELLDRALTSSHVTVYGFYCHAGQSYASSSPEEASSFLTIELESVNNAAKLAKSRIEELKLDASREAFILSVGSTPTAHAANLANKAKLASLLYGDLELHAGNYPLLDLQQLHTGLIERSNISQYVTATVISYYSGRGVQGRDEALCDAGAIAMSKDTGPSGTFGEVIGKPWKLGRVSQEHGILTADNLTKDESEDVKVGEIVHIIGQHACLTLAAYPWYYIVDSSTGANGDVVEDVWVPWKGW
ncbi:hypothetical protein EIP91_007216 [Steccherinum ochraceum]|uniref:D-serine dehydratase n=1 Tax=Steccherinum ochraceum TaxID=92696 RepID=A0A4R0R4I3_9APHY|nr:hypothetical protein EIP91_007216 [Steccherinum ochraceum]